MNQSWLKKFLALAFVFLCYASIEVRAQNVIFGPKKYTQTRRVPRANTFLVSDPTVPFVLTVQQSLKRRIKSLVVKINGVQLDGLTEFRQEQIVRSVTLQRRNTIAVEVRGQPGASVVLSISPVPQYTLYTNPQDPLLLRAQMPDGAVVEYFGAKSAAGDATAIKSVSVKNAKGQINTYFFDEDSRLSEIRSFNGLQLRFAWKSDTFANLTAVSPDGLNQVTAPIDFSKLTEKQSSSKVESCGSCVRPDGHKFVNQNRVDSENSHVAFLPPLDFWRPSNLDNSARYSSVSDGSVVEACIKIAKALAPICRTINMGLNLPGAKKLVCLGLATAAAASGYGAWLVPFLLTGSCELILVGVQVACYGIQIIDLYDGCTQIKRFFTSVGDYIAGKAVVSTSLRHAPSAGPFTPGQTLTATFTVTNRGHMNLSMSKILISGRIGETCPNNICPDSSPIVNNVTLAPGQSYNYFGTIKPSQNGTYTFAVAYQKPDGSWVNPVDTENGTINKLSITVQSPAPRPVVSTSLRLSPNSGPYSVGQPLTGTFSITNRGNANAVMSKVLIGGRLGDSCPNNSCPDFSPVPSNLTLTPGQTYNYSGTFKPGLSGTYTFSVVYQKPDGSWVIPVDTENGTINRLSLTVQAPVGRPVVSTSLRFAQGNGPFNVGQKLDGTFTIANRGSARLSMKQLVIGGRFADTCPDNQCPDFQPIPRDITLEPGQTKNYVGTITLLREGTYTFSVAYEKSDGKWEMPVASENGTINKLSIKVQGPQVTLTGADPAYIYASPKKQIVFLTGTRLTTVLYCRVRSSTGQVSNIYIPLGEVVIGTDNRLKINTEFRTRGTYYISAYTQFGPSNELAFQVR